MNVTEHSQGRDWLVLLTSVDLGRSRVERRMRIVAFERALAELMDFKGLDNTAGDLGLKHRFAPGAYIREVTLPAGQIIVGKIHRHEHLNFISRGDVTVVTECGGVERLRGPMTMVSPAGTKRIVYTHEETVWTTVHVTDKTELDEIEAETIAPSYKALGWWDPVEAMLTVEEEKLCLGL